MEQVWNFTTQVQLSSKVKALLQATLKLVIYYIWKARNERKFKDITMTLESVIRKVQQWVYIYGHFYPGTSATSEFRIMEKLKILQREDRFLTLIDIQWCPPSIEFIKFNSDGISKGNPGYSTS